MWQQIGHRPGFARRSLVGPGAVLLAGLLCANGTAAEGTGSGVPARAAVSPPRKSDSVVKVTAAADRPTADGMQVITVRFAIDTDKPWHIYANPLPATVPGVATTVTVGGVNAQDVRVEYPEGQLVRDPDFGDYHVYSGDLAVKVTVRRPQGDAGPLELNAIFQACWQTKDNGLCLPKATVKLAVP